MTFLSENIKSLRCRKVLSVDGKSIEGSGKKLRVLGEFEGESGKQKVEVEFQALKVKSKLFTKKWLLKVGSLLYSCFSSVVESFGISPNEVVHGIFERCHDR
jgi:hypothetical protein